jgi:phosphoglycolate phosphatase-like HAD superfamily hydrolase
LKLLITDLDNTLYDWVTYFARAFDAMSRALENIVEVPRERLLDEFKAVHRRYGNSEQPFAVLELPSVQTRFGSKDRRRLRAAVDPALQVFNAERRKYLVLYSSVRDTLEALRRRGVRVVGHTEAIAINALYRLRFLEIDKLFSRLYVLEGLALEHPEPNRSMNLDLPKGFVRTVTRDERKPNPRLLLDICREEGVEPRSALYVGDSLSRDMSMAQDAGVVAVWAKYGTQYDRKLWDVLVRVTHWTEEDVRREEVFRSRASRVTPDFTIDSFDELLKIVDADPAPHPLRVVHA